MNQTQRRTTFLGFASLGFCLIFAAANFSSDQEDHYDSINGKNKTKLKHLIHKLKFFK